VHSYIVRVDAAAEPRQNHWQHRSQTADSRAAKGSLPLPNRASALSSVCPVNYEKGSVRLSLWGLFTALSLCGEILGRAWRRVTTGSHWIHTDVGDLFADTCGTCVSRSSHMRNTYVHKHKRTYRFVGQRDTNTNTNTRKHRRSFCSVHSMNFLNGLSHSACSAKNEKKHARTPSDPRALSSKGRQKVASLSKTFKH
jgi:hypothetical protein